ncbi:MAG: tRNA (adenosine(37)-N6)-threonylcarbamoyltransferase complex dimerization subunit type 1 TsaB [Alphaproteobacteria bacterium]
MRILAIDTATAACSAALMVGDAIVTRRFVPMARGHAEALMPMVEAVMAEAGAAYGDLDLIATTVGPGTFTGLRVGLAAARGLAVAGGLPVVGVTTLEALAHGVDPGVRQGRSVVAALDARRGEVYVQAFDDGLKPVAPAAALRPLAAVLPAGPVVIAGSGAGLVRGALDRGGADVVIDDALLPDAAVVAALAGRRFDPGVATPPPEPLYLRGSGARLPPGAAP